MKNVVIADDHSVVRHGLKRILSQSSDFSIVGEAASVSELRAVLLSQQEVHALVLDLSMPGGGGLEALGDIKSHYPTIAVLILSMHPEDQFALRAFRGGASGYLCKECAPDQLVTALQNITEGRRFFTKKTADLICDELDEKSKVKALSHGCLSDRELYVFTGLGQGHTLTQIAQDLFLSVKTVSTYRQRILKKMKMTTNAQIVKYVVHHGLVS